MNNKLMPLYLGVIIIVSIIVIGYNHDLQKQTVHRPNNVLHEGDKIAMPEFYRRITGFDSIQLVAGGRGKYNEEKKDFDVTWDSLFVHFCYPNEWEFEKFKILNNSGIKIGNHKGDIIVGDKNVYK